MEEGRRRRDKKRQEREEREEREAKEEKKGKKEKMRQSLLALGIYALSHEKADRLTCLQDHK